MTSGNGIGGRWIVAGTPVGDPYPCRCGERRGDTCSVKWCPCSGRVDLENVPADCCSRWYDPEAFTAAWREGRQ